MVEESSKEEADKTKMTHLEEIAKGVQDVLAISKLGRQGQGSKSKETEEILVQISLTISVTTATRWDTCAGNVPSPKPHFRALGLTRVALSDEDSPPAMEDSNKTLVLAGPDRSLEERPAEV